MSQPFEGVRIVEVGDSIAVAGATKVLGDYGAQVTKVETRGGGELRRVGPFRGDVPDLNSGAYHLALDTGKRSIVLDHGTPSGLEVLTRLGERSDVVVLHQPAAAGLRLAEAFERLGDGGPSVVTMSVHGLEGPFAGREENDLSLFAWSNRMLRHSFDDQEPMRYSPNVASLQWASTATAVTAATIWGRRHDGVRRRVDVAGVEALAGSVDNWFVPWSFTGANTPRPATPSRAAFPPPTLRATDGYLAISAANEPFFSRFCAGIGHPELAQDPRFTDAAQKADHYDEFMQHVDAYLATHTRDEAFRELQSFGVMIAPILDVGEAFENEQARVRGSYVQVEQPGFGTHTIAGAPFRLEDGWEAGPAPDLGQHTHEVLAEIGYTADEEIALFRAGVTG